MMRTIVPVVTALTVIHVARLFGDDDAIKPPVLIDLNDDEHRQVVVDREAEQYLGHPTTCLLEDGKTMLCVYPKGHGRGAIVYKRSTDGGLTWSERLPTPANWSTSLEVPTLHRVVDAEGKRRIIMWSGLYPARLAVSEDDGATWGPLEPVGDWGGIVTMGFVEPLKTDQAITWPCSTTTDGSSPSMESVQTRSNCTRPFPPMAVSTGHFPRSCSNRRTCNSANQVVFARPTGRPWRYCFGKTRVVRTPT